MVLTKKVLFLFSISQSQLTFILCTMHLPEFVVDLLAPGLAQLLPADAAGATGSFSSTTLTPYHGTTGTLEGGRGKSY